MHYKALALTLFYTNNELLYVRSTYAKKVVGSLTLQSYNIMTYKHEPIHVMHIFNTSSRVLVIIKDV